MIDRLARYLEGPIRSPSGFFHPAVGQYLVEMNGGGQCKICIDSRDAGEIASPELMAWSDVYFKTNVWLSMGYPQKVSPMVNGNPIVLNKLAQLRSYRTMAKKYDLCFIVRVWGGKHGVDGIEQNIRLLEVQARVECNKFLLAYLTVGDIAACAKRLDRHGIPWTTYPMPLLELWRVSAQSKLTLIRHGMHYCVPWRMIDSIAMGACPVLDHAPYTVWPQPMIEGEHFLSLGVEANPEVPCGPGEQYAAIPAKIEGWLAEDDLIARIGKNNCEYFEHFLAPEKVGEYIIERIGAGGEKAGVGGGSRNRDER